MFTITLHHSSHLKVQLDIFINRPNYTEIIAGQTWKRAGPPISIELARIRLE
jgi:hypothetical protein